MYELWIRCTDDCPEPQPGGERKLITLEYPHVAEHFAKSLSDMHHTAEVREVRE